jgi:hypothetical protein
MSCQLSIEKYFRKFKSMRHHLMPHQLSPLKNNSKNSRKSPKSHHPSILKNNSEKIKEHAASYFYIKNNFENSRKSPHLTSHFSIKK